MACGTWAMGRGAWSPPSSDGAGVDQPEDASAAFRDLELECVRSVLREFQELLFNQEEEERV